MGVRYIVWIDGVTQKTDGGGSIACAAGPGGAGCLGLGWWEKTSDYEATVWDLREGVSAGSLTTDVKGTSVMIGAIAPIPLIAPVQSTACDRLAGQLKAFLLGTATRKRRRSRAAVVDSPSRRGSSACCDAEADLNRGTADADRKRMAEWRSARVQVMGRRVSAATAA